MLQNRFVAFLRVNAAEMVSEIRVSGVWPIDIIGHIIGGRRFFSAMFLTACRKKAE